MNKHHALIHTMNVISIIGDPVQLENFTTNIFDGNLDIGIDIDAETEVLLLACIASNIHTPQYILDMLADHHDATICCAVARNINAIQISRVGYPTLLIFSSYFQIYIICLVLREWSLDTDMKGSTHVE